jgi:MFS family permease
MKSPYDALRAVNAIPEDTSVPPPNIAVSKAQSLLLAIMYFCNQRPGIFVAPYLLMRGWRESHIGVVLFISGLVGLGVQTPAGQLVDDTVHKKLIIIICNLWTIIGCLCLIYIDSFVVILIAVTASVVSDSFTYPSLYALTLGMVGTKGITDQVPVNETSTHVGNAFFAILSGVLATVSSNGGLAIFWICVVMRSFSILALSFVNESSIDQAKARGLETDNGEIVVSQPMSYYQLLTDMHVIIFVICIMMFHFSNAAMLPLLSQSLYISNNDLGFQFAALAVIIAQLSMVVSAVGAGYFVKRFGSKPLFICAMSAIPIRGFIIALLIAYYPHNILLLATQFLDGLAGGIIGVLIVLVSENLAR